MKIYLKLKTPPKTIAELLTKLFSFHSNFNEFFSVDTFYDENCKIKQCSAGRYRSIDDVILIVKTYFPNESETTIFNEIFNLIIIDENYNIFVPYLVDCHDIQKPTLCFYNGAIIHTKGEQLANSKYNWKDIWELIGFKDREDVLNHFKKQIRENV